MGIFELSSWALKSTKVSSGCFDMNIEVTFTVNFSTMYVNIIDTLQKKLSDDLPSFQGTKIWKLRTITRSGSGDTLAVSRGYHRGTGNSGIPGFRILKPSEFLGRWF